MVIISRTKFTLCKQILKTTIKTSASQETALIMVIVIQY